MGVTYGEVSTTTWCGSPHKRVATTTWWWIGPQKGGFTYRGVYRQRGEGSHTEGSTDRGGGEGGDHIQSGLHHVVVGPHTGRFHHYVVEGINRHITRASTTHRKVSTT